MKKRASVDCGKIESGTTNQNKCPSRLMGVSLSAPQDLNKAEQAQCTTVALFSNRDRCAVRELRGMRTHGAKIASGVVPGLLQQWRQNARALPFSSDMPTP